VKLKELETLVESQELEWKSEWAGKMRCACFCVSSEMTRFRSTPRGSATQVSLDSLLFSEGRYAWVDQTAY
jgi:hypothetical protein